MPAYVGTAANGTSGYCLIADGTFQSLCGIGGTAVQTTFPEIMALTYNQQTAWNEWVQYSTVSTTAATYTLQAQVWPHWHAWQSQNATLHYQTRASEYVRGTLRQPRVEVVSEASRNAVRETHERAERERQSHAQQQQRAVDRSRLLLLQMLSAEQEDQFQAVGYFELRVNARRYRITPTGGYYSRVEEVTEAGVILSSFCIHPPTHHGLPSFDVALGQKLLLEASEAEFLRVANRTILTPPAEANVGAAFVRIGEEAA